MKPDIHPFAVNVRKLQRYNFDFFSIEEVVFFEYIVVKGISFGGEFYHSSETIRRQTGIKKHALKTIINRFERLGIFSLRIKGMPRVKYFMLNHNAVINLLPQIYLLHTPMVENNNLHTLLLNYLKQHQQDSTEYAMQ